MQFFCKNPYLQKFEIKSSDIFLAILNCYRYRTEELSNVILILYAQCLQ